MAIVLHELDFIPGHDCAVARCVNRRCRVGLTWHARANEGLSMLRPDACPLCGGQVAATNRGAKVTRWILLPGAFVVAGALADAYAVLDQARRAVEDGERSAGTSEWALKSARWRFENAYSRARSLELWAATAPAVVVGRTTAHVIAGREPSSAETIMVTTAPVEAGASEPAPLADHDRCVAAALTAAVLNVADPQGASAISRAIANLASP